MPPEKRELLKKFANDQALAKAVHGVLVKCFLKPPKNKDVQSLAAAWMAKDIMDEAWHELMLFKHDGQPAKDPRSQVGL